MSISAITDPSRLADIVVAHLSMKIEEKQEILDALNVSVRLENFFKKCKARSKLLMLKRRFELA